MLGNGLTVLVRRDDTAPVVAIVTHVKAGYFDETDDVAGVAHVLEHMYFKGTRRRSVGEISQATKAAGGYLNAGTIYDHTVYYTVLPSSGFLSGLDIQADAYIDSLIDAGELSKELEVIIQEARRKADNPGAVCVETLYEVLHDRHRMRRWRIGREEGLRRLTRDDVAGFYRTFYRPSNTILAVVGDVDPDMVLAEVERAYGGLAAGTVRHSRGPAEPERRERRVRVLSGDVNQAQLAIGWRTPPSLHEDTARLEMAATVLGAGRASRLYRGVRERALASSVGAFNYTPTELGVFVIHAEGPAATTADAMRAIWSELGDVRAGGVLESELVRGRRLVEARHTRQLETMEGQATYLAEWEALGDWQLGDEHLARRLATTPRAMVDAVSRWLDAAGCGVVSYVPLGVVADGDGLLALLDALPAAEPVGGAPMPEPIAPPPRGPEPVLEASVGDVCVYRTPRGVPVLVRRTHGAPLAHVAVYAVGGASEEPPELAGLTAMVVRTALKGTPRRDAARIAADAELLGGSIRPGVGPESFGWSLSVPAAHCAEALALLADVAQHASIPPAALDTEREVAIADLATLRDDMYQWPLRRLAEAAFAGHPYGVPTSGDADTLGALDADRVRAWHRARCLTGPVAIAIVGNVDPTTAARDAARCFDALAPGPAAPVEVPRWPDQLVTVRESRDKTQTALAMAFPAPDRSDVERVAARLVAGIASGLGGRFFEELRDRRSLAYTVSAFTSVRRRAGMFVSYIATAPANEAVARRGLLDEIARFRDVPVSERELERAKAYAIGTHAIRQQSGAAVLSDLLEVWMFGRSLAELDEHDARVRAVSSDDVQRVARRYFDETRRVEAIVAGP